MSDGDFPFQSFTLRSEGYDQSEVDNYVAQLRGEIVEQRRALETATRASDDDARLHDPEGAVTRTLAIAQETADRVLHDAQVEADRRRIYAEEQANTTIREADSRAATMLAEIEAQATEVREQGIAAARSAIKVERDKAMAELSQVRRVRDDLRDEAADLKSALDRYRIQAREASDVLGSAATGPLNAIDLPDFVDDEVALAGVVTTGFAGSAMASTTESGTSGALDEVRFAEPDDLDLDAGYEVLGRSDDALVDIDASRAQEIDSEDVADIDDSVITELDDDDGELAEVLAFDADVPGAPTRGAAAGAGGAFLSEVRAAAEEGDDESDRFLSELRGASDGDIEIVDETADAFFGDDD